MNPVPLVVASLLAVQLFAGLGSGHSGSTAAGLMASGREVPATGARSWQTPSAGSFLIASRWLQDPNFAETVIFLLEAGEQGAMGVIINRQTSLPASAALPHLEALQQRDDVLYAGGPVEPLKPIFLARTSSPPAASKMVLGDEVFLLTSLEAVRELLEDETPGESSLRVFAGYAGWGPGQLEAEIARLGWHLMPASPDWIFAAKPLRVWSDLLDIVFMPTA